MNRIRLLSEQVANQIAAGEVVERPASAVKELVENSIDAGAGHIQVEVQAGGRSLVRVSDDGGGMSRDDALLCLERHATSKITSAGDLFRISTMGFRGEALPSIASVSRMSIVTRERDSASPEGTEIVIHGGKILEVKAAGAAPGTVVEVRQLFFNVPARRKFLRSEETEKAHIQHYITLAALAQPQISFTLVLDGRESRRLPAQTSHEPFVALKRRLQDLMDAATPLLAVDHTAELPVVPAVNTDGEESGPVKLRVWGYIGAPGVSRSTREDQHLFVNRRPVDNRGLNFALMEGYHTSLMKGRYPVCCLFVEIDPAEVDVNIHPSKKEVKFRHEGAVRREVAAAIRNTLLSWHTQKPAVALPQTARLEVPSRADEHQGELAIPDAPKPPAAPIPQQAVPVATAATPHPATAPLPNFPIANWPERAIPQPVESPALPLGFARPQSINQPTTPVPLLRVPLRVVGVVGRLYVVLESDRGMVLLDQHAAHERILFEQMLARLEHGDAPSQRLLLPETVELGPRDAGFLRENLKALTRLGVGLSEFGERTFLLDAIPPFVKTGDARKFVLDVLDSLKSAGNEVNACRLGEDVVAKTVCRHAVKANDPLQGRELDNLVADLKKCAMPYTCPHGRPTLIEFSHRELEKRFGRSQ